MKRNLMDFNIYMADGLLEDIGIVYCNFHVCLIFKSSVNVLDRILKITYE